MERKEGNERKGKERKGKERKGKKGKKSKREAPVHLAIAPGYGQPYSRHPQKAYVTPLPSTSHPPVSPKQMCCRVSPWPAFHDNQTFPLFHSTFLPGTMPLLSNLLPQRMYLLLPRDSLFKEVLSTLPALTAPPALV